MKTELNAMSVDRAQEASSLAENESGKQKYDVHVQIQGYVELHVQIQWYVELHVQI